MNIFISELKEPIVKILYIYTLIAIAKYWYLNKNERRILKKNSTISFNRRLSVAEKLKTFKYAEERSIHAASNLWSFKINKKILMKEKEELINAKKISTITLLKNQISKNSFTLIFWFNSI